MGAISLTSAAVDTRSRVTPQTQPFGATAPSTTLPLLFVLAGLTALFASVVWLVVHPEMIAVYHYNPGAVAVTHLFVLGWICSVVMGALYQLVPVALETKLYSERLAQIQFGFHVTGFVGMVWMFQNWNLKGVAQFGSVFAIGIALLFFNIARTLMRVPKWSVIATAVASAIGWVVLAVAAGLALALAKSCSESLPGLASFIFRFDPIGAMHAHAHLGAIGLFIILIVGVSYKLIPMFTLSELQSERRANWSIALLNIGLAGVFCTILSRSPWRFAFALMVTAALALYGWELLAILRARKRRALDWGVKSFLTAVGILAPLSLIALVLSWPGLPLNNYTAQLENVYGFAGLVGVVSLAIIGMLYKIVPFLVWFGSYSPHIGRSQVPALADLYSRPFQIAGYWSYLAGLLTSALAIELSHPSAVRAGCSLIALSLGLLGVNIAQMLRHYFRPQLAPLPKIIQTRVAL